MRRRQFLGAIGGAAVTAWPISGHAQTAMPVIGFLHSASPGYFAPFAPSFHEGLKQAGFTEQQNATIEYRWAEGHYERLPALAADLVDRQVKVIFAAGGTDPAKAAKAATGKIPVIFVSAADPVTTGLVASLNRPGGNVTGVSLLASALEAKKLGLMRQLIPKASAIGMLVNPNYPSAKVQLEEFREAASQLGIQGIALSAGTADEIDAAFGMLVQQGGGGLIAAADPFMLGRRAQFAALASRYAIPAIYAQREMVAAGGLASYGPSFADGYRQGGVYVGRVLAGESPSDLPVMQPTKFELVINLKTARTLGLDIPATLLALADEVIE